MGRIQFARTAPEAREQRRQAGAWLKQLRARAGLSQIELAERLGFKYYTFVSQVENGFGRVPTESLGAGARRQAFDFRAAASVVLRPGAASNPVRGQTMNVVEFPVRRARRGNWTAGELAQVVAGVAGSVESGAAAGWELGTTESGDP